MSEGTQTFLSIFYNISEQIRKRQYQGPDPRFLQIVAQRNLRVAAFFDPNDPSQIFFSQPAQPYDGLSQVSIVTLVINWKI